MTLNGMRRYHADLAEGASRTGHRTNFSTPDPITLDRKDKESIAEDTGTRYTIVDIKPHVQTNDCEPPVVRDYTYDEPPQPPLTDFFRGGVKRLITEEALAPLTHAAKERSADLTELRDLAAIEKMSDEQSGRFNRLQNEFEAKFGRSWRMHVADEPLAVPDEDGDEFDEADLDNDPDFARLIKAADRGMRVAA